MKGRKNFTDQERYEYVRRYKISGKPLKTFAEEEGISRGTLRDWVSAYNNLSGKFININTVSGKKDNLIEEKDVVVNILGEAEKIKKSTHFSRFDHSVVVIEYKGLKITTSLEQADKLLEKIYARL